MDEEAVVDRLRALELTEYQARVYAAAVRLGSASPTELADESGVPQSRVYDVIDDLEAMGLVEDREASEGKLVVTPPPTQTLEAFKDRRIDEFVEKLDAAVSGLETFHETEDVAGQFITMVRLRRSAIRHVRRAIDSAEWWLSLALPLDVFQAVEDEVIAAVDRGVNVRLVVPEPDESIDASAARYPDGVAVRQRLLADVLTLADRRYGVFSSLTSQAESPNYVIIQEPNLVFQLQNFYEMFWPASTELQAQTGFPRRYLDPWRTLKNIADDIDDGVEFHATATGYHNVRERTGSWEGPITGYDLSGPVDADYKALLPTKANLFMELDGETVGVGGRRARQMEIAADVLEIDRP